MPGEKDKKKKKLDMKKKPKWMSSDMYELANDIPALVQLFLGDKKDISRTKEIKYEVQITRQQAGLFLWQLVFADKKEMKENRDLCMKQNVLDVCNQVLKGGNTAEMTPAIGIITACTKGELKYRANLLELKPPAIPRILDSLKLGSASLTAAACSCIKFLARAEDTQPRLIKYMKEMDWGPLLGALKLSDPMTSFGGKAAASDVMELLDCFIASANPGVVALAQRKILECNGIETIMEVMRSRWTLPFTRATGAVLLHNLMRSFPTSMCEEVCLQHGGIRVFTDIIQHYIIPLTSKAHAAGCLLRFVMPEALWRAAQKPSGSAGGPRPGTSGSAMSGMASTSIAYPVSAAAEEASKSMFGATRTMQAGPPPGSAEGAPAAAAAPPGEGAAPPAAGAPGPAAPGPADADADPAAVQEMASRDILKFAVANDIEALGIDRMTLAGGPPGQGFDELIPDNSLLTEEVKQQILERAQKLVEAHSLVPLIQLCVGPEGPLPDLLRPEEEGEGEGVAAEKSGKGGKKGKKGKGKGKGKGKKGKMEPGMAEAQSLASGVIRLVSLRDEFKLMLMNQGVLRYIVPLLDSKVHMARWNARQTLLNLSMHPALLEPLKAYSVPDFITFDNIPATHYQRPLEAKLASLYIGTGGPKPAAPAPAPPTSATSATSASLPPKLASAAQGSLGGRMSSATGSRGSQSGAAPAGGADATASRPMLTRQPSVRMQPSAGTLPAQPSSGVDSTAAPAGAAAAPLSAQRSSMAGGPPAAPLASAEST